MKGRVYCKYLAKWVDFDFGNLLFVGMGRLDPSTLPPYSFFCFDSGIERRLCCWGHRNAVVLDWPQMWQNVIFL